MSYIRRLPSGKWQATVRGPDGRATPRQTGSRRVRKWAASRKRWPRGEFRDPRLGDIKVGDWHARVIRARGIEDITRPRTHPCGARTASRNGRPGRWARSPALRPRSGWNRLKATRRARHKGRPAEPGDEDVPVIGPATIHDVVHLMSQAVHGGDAGAPAARAREPVRRPGAAEDRAAAGRVPTSTRRPRPCMWRRKPGRGGGR